MNIDRLDHLVLTVRDPEATLSFYERLGMRRIRFDGRDALRFGRSKINIHPTDGIIQPAARQPTPGSGDLCFVVDDAADAIVEAVRAAGIEIELGPVARTGAEGPITSVYVRDPDGNLLEFATYRSSDD